MIQPINAQTALKVYYEHPAEIGNTQIRQLFGDISGSSIAKLKRKAKELQVKNDVHIFNHACVNTKTAYRAWGIDIDAVKDAFNELKRLKL